MEVGESRAVQVQHIGQGAVHGAAVGDDLALGKDAEAVDELLDQVEEDGGGQHGHGDLPEPLQGGGAVHGGGLIQRGGDLLEARQEDQHRGTELPHAHQDDDRQGGARVAHQGILLFDAEHLQQAHDDAVVAEDLLPHHRNGDASADDGGHVIQHPVHRHAHVLFVQQIGNKEGEGQPKRHHDKDVDKGHSQGLPEVFVGGQDGNVVLQAHPLGRGQQVVVGKGIVDGHDRRDQPHQQESHQPGRQQQVAGGVVLGSVVGFGLDCLRFHHSGENLLHREWTGDRKRGKGGSPPPGTDQLLVARMELACSRKEAAASSAETWP